MSKKLSKRQHVRDPSAVMVFCDRFARAISHIRLSQAALAQQLGGFPPQLISRLVTGDAKAVPIDFLVNLADLLDAQGLSLRWLLTGMGPMEKDVIAGGAVVAQHLNQARMLAVIEALAKRVGVDLEDVLRTLELTAYVADEGYVTMSASEAQTAASKQKQQR